MKIRYRRRLSNLYLISTLLFGLLILLVFPRTGLDSNLKIMGFAAALSALFALVMRYKPYCELYQRQLVILPLISWFGIHWNAYPFHSTDEFKLVGNRLYLRQNGQQKRIPINIKYVEPEDWKALLQALNLAP